MQKGTPYNNLNLNVRGTKPSATVATNERSNALIPEGRQVYKLGLGQSPLPVAEPVVEALRHNAAEKDYLPVCGLKRLRDAVAAYHHRTDGVERTGDDVEVIGGLAKGVVVVAQGSFLLKGQLLRSSLGDDD